MKALKCMPGRHALLTEALSRAGWVASGFGRCNSSSQVGCMNTAKVFLANSCDGCKGPCSASGLLPRCHPSAVLACCHTATMPFYCAATMP